MASAHLHRLSQIWVRFPVYFITTTVAGRRRLLDDERIAAILIDELCGLKKRHGWMVGRFVIMPDHVHFFLADLREESRLEQVVQRWKEWTAKRALRELHLEAPLWQREFFDHLIRSRSSYAEKWEYVRMNPVIAGLVAHPDDWPYQGCIDFDWEY